MSAVSKISNTASLPKPTPHAERYWPLAKKETNPFSQTYIRACKFDKLGFSEIRFGEMSWNRLTYLYP